MNLSSIPAFSSRHRRFSPIASDGGFDDWAVRAAASGVILANRLQDQATLNAWTLVDGTEGNITLDTTIKPPGALGSARIAVLSSHGSNSGSIGVYFGDVTTFGNGSHFWVSCRVRSPAQECFQPYPQLGGLGSQSQPKRVIVSKRTGSNQVNELVPVLSEGSGSWGFYHQTGGGAFPAFNPINVAASTNCSSTDFKYQPAVDRGSNPLTGNDPDTGSAWSACAQDRARYGLLYAARSLSSYALGPGDSIAGGPKQWPDEWQTLTLEVIIGTFGTESNTVRMWVARDGLPYVKVIDSSGIMLGNGPNYDTMWLLPYVTTRAAGGRKATARTTNITGAEILVTGLNTPIGDGTLEYNASTGRFRWMGAAETFGTARGYSAANGILIINVKSGTDNDSYVVLRITPGSLPPSGTLTDTVTIADGRPDSQINYADALISTSAINAPGGFAPT